MSVQPGYWLGHPGALLPLPDVGGALTRNVERAASYKTSASGRVRAYLSARSAQPREWKVTIPAIRPDEAALLHGLLTGTDPPYVWVDPYSRATNLLTPITAGLSDAVPALVPLGRQPLAGGLWAATGGAIPGGGVINLPPAPVVPDQPVTVSAYLGSAGSATVSARFLNSNGAQTGSIVTSAPVTGLTRLNRASVTVAVPPVTAAAVAVRITGASVVAHPAVTWTAELLEYGAGGGAAQVVVTGFDESFDVAGLTVAEQRLSSITFTVVEVG